MKYGEADTVYAHAIRVLPEPGGSGRQEEELYTELTSFIKYSGVNFLELSKPLYTRLQQLVGKKPGEGWTDDDRREFSSIYYHFRKTYEALGGNKLTSTRGDAFLAFIEVYGYPALRCSTENQIKKMLSKAWEDIALQQKDVAIDLKLDPDEEKKPGLLTQVLSIGERKEKKVAFIHEDNCDVSHGFGLTRMAGSTHSGYWAILCRSHPISTPWKPVRQKCWSRLSPTGTP